MATIETAILLTALRESLEAFLIVSILTGLVIKLGHAEYRRYVFWGAGVGAALSIVLGSFLFEVTDRFLSQNDRAEILEGLVALLAVGILTYMVIWMYRHTLHMVATFREKAAAALKAGKPAIMFSLAFVAVFREGVETALFASTQTETKAALDVVFSLALGILASTVLALLLFTGIIRLNMKRFFAASGALLILFAGGMVVYGLHELTEAGWFPQTEHVYDLSSIAILHHKKGVLGAFLNGVIGWRVSLTILEALAYVGYVVGIGAWYLRGVLATRVAPAPTPLQG